QNARACKHHQQITAAHGDHCRCNTKQTHEVIIQIRCKKRSAAESHDRHTCSHATTIGKPLHKCTHRRNVTETATNPADYSHPEKHEDRLFQGQSDSPDKKTASKEQCCRSRRSSRPSPFDPGPAKRGA